MSASDQPIVLLPCPFCGCVDFVIESLPKIREKHRKRVMCNKRHACGPESWHESAWHSRENAKETWNIRLGRNTKINIRAEAERLGVKEHDPVIGLIGQ